MYIDFSSVFHHSSKDLRDKGRVDIPSDDTKWPMEWKTTYYKSYPRMPKVALSREKLEADVGETLLQRHSNRNFTGKLSQKELSQLLLYATGISRERRGGENRTYASGGARYPIEIYPLVFKPIGEIAPGVYHYNVRDHMLDTLFVREFQKSDIAKLYGYEWAQNASCALILTSVFWRNQIKYGERGYRYILLETGHIGQNLYIVSQALGVKCCAIGSIHEDGIHALLDIDGITEALVHSVIVG